MPNYNKCDYLDKAISSVIKQSHKNWQLYIIDDNSKDSIEKYFEKIYKK